ncbi:hypothetical protein ACJIZ3_019872 [Penstemon smallii]|uniref:RRM domain-containing protein n=1 Tax=Penstemon smallii TaxID=265156 RepID=A0ABD3T3D0_9LAMI
MNLFAKHMCKVPQGYKLMSLGVNNHTMAQAPKSSSKLIVSNDGKKVRRKNPFKEKEKDELRFHFSPFESCTVIAENLPDDHSHQNIQKIFSVIGSIKAIRICQPQKPSSSRSCKGDSVVSHKLHALVEYENPETVERAATKLNDEKNGRKGMCVRVLLKCTVNVHPKSVLKSRKSGFDGYLDDDDDDDDDDGLLHILQKDATRLNVSEVAEVSESDRQQRGSWSNLLLGQPQAQAQAFGPRSVPLRVVQLAHRLNYKYHLHLRRKGIFWGPAPWSKPCARIST